jgi:spore maturation protein CgeB
MRPILKIYHVGLNAGTNDGLEQSFKKNFNYQWVNTSDKNLNLKIVSDCKAFNPDLVFIQVQTPNIIYNDTLAAIRPYCGKIFNFTGDVRDPLPNWYIETGMHVDLTLFVSMDDVRKASPYINCNWIQIGFDNIFFSKLTPPVPAADIVFMANNYGSFPISNYRKQIVQALQKEFKSKFEVFGSGWATARNINNSLIKQAQIYRGCKIAINCSHYNHSMYSSDRILRIMGSGAFCLSQEFKDWNILYGDHLRIFNDIPDLLEKCHYYLEKEDERKNIAERGYEFTHNLYSWDKFVENLIYYYDL